MKLTPTDVDPNRLSLLAVKVGGVLFAAIVGLSIGRGAFQNAALVVMGLVALFLWFYSYQGFLMLCVGASFLGGTSPIIPSGLRFFEVLALMAVARLLLEQVVLRRRKLQRGPTLDWYLIMGFMSVVFWHAATNRMGMKAFGAEVWGGRQYIGLFLGFALYIGFQTIHIDVKRWRWLPLVVVAATSWDGILTLLRRFIPEINAVVATLYDIGEEVVEYNPMDMGARLGAVGTAGVMILLGVLAHRRFSTLLIPRVSSLMAILGGFLVLAGGFRSSALNAALMAGAAALRDLKSRALLPLGMVAGLILFAVLLQGTVISLPAQVQRALVFLPGDWDSSVVQSANSSDDFRRETWAKWREKYFPKNPWFGRGFGFNPNELAVWQFSLADQHIRESLLVTQEVHNGFYSSLDCIGIVGTAFLIAWVLATLIRITRYLLSRDPRGDAPAVRWAAFYLLSFSLLYWIGALKVSQFLAVQFMMTSLFIRLLEESSKEEAPVPVELGAYGKRHLISTSPARGADRFARRAAQNRVSISSKRNDSSL